MQPTEENSPRASKPWEADYYHCRLRRWATFETGLRGLLTLLVQEQGRFLVISNRSGKRYIQFAVEKDGAIFAEAVSNSFLAGPERLSETDCGKLLELSWENPGKRTPNFWRQVPPPVPIGDLASLGVRTLRDVLCVPTPTQLDIRRGVF
jgi:hypothetical protein